MEPFFPRLNAAVRQTIEYSEIYKIRDHIFKFSGEVNLGYLEKWIELTYSLQENMEDEIKQTLFTTTEPTQLFLIQLLDDWLNDSRITVNMPQLNFMVNNYNQKVYASFLEEVRKEEEIFLNHPNYNKWRHKEEYQVKSSGFGLVGSLSPFYSDYTVTHYKYHCVTHKAPLIDTDFIPDYINLVTPIFNNFKRILIKYVEQFKSGLIPYKNSTFIPFQISQIDLSQYKKIDVPEPVKSKLKVKLTVEQLAYFFRLLKDESLIETDFFNEIHEFVCQNFTTPKTPNGISVNKFTIAFSSPEKKTAKSLIPILRNMNDAASKI